VCVCACVCVLCVCVCVCVCVRVCTVLSECAVGGLEAVTLKDKMMLDTEEVNPKP
jgi:hypothetical protein